ncbi:MAG: hypothetical protein FWG65_04420 [Turicibacter sp.]|nr:hypothetical protein [Turicibacter sp.]
MKNLTQLLVLSIMFILYACAVQENPISDYAQHLENISDNQTILDETENWQRTNLRDLILRQIDDVREFLGNEISSEYDEHQFVYRYYYFDSDLTLATGELNQIISIFLDFNEDNRSRFHVDGIDDFSTFDDVVSKFGENPHIIRDTMVRGRLGVGYGYWLGETHEFIYFNFDGNNEMMGFSLLLGERHFDN